MGSNVHGLVTAQPCLSFGAPLPPLPTFRPRGAVQRDAMSSVIADLRYAGREFRRRPGFAATAVLSLALGIGATSAVFSVIYGVLLNPFPYVDSERMMQLGLRDEAGRMRCTGLSGAQLEQLRQARTLESVVAEDGWNLTTTDGDIPEDVVASYISPNAPNHWGNKALMGRWLIPADAPAGARRRAHRRPRVSVLAAVLRRRSGRGGPDDSTGPEELRDRGRDAAAVPVARGRPLHAAGGQVRAEHLLRRQHPHQTGRVGRRRQRRPAADPGALREGDPRTLPRQVPRPSAQHRRALCPADGAEAAVAAGRGGVAAARRLRQRVDPAARARRPSPAGAVRPRGPRRQPGPHRAAAPDRGHGHCHRRDRVRSADRLEGAGAHRLLDSHQLVRRGIGDRDERAGAARQHVARRGDRRGVRRLARPAALAPRPRARDPGRRASRHGQRAGAAHAPCHGGGAGGADAADADGGGSGGEGVPAAGQRRSRLRPAERDVAANPGPRWHLQDVEGTIRVFRTAARRGGGHAQRRSRRHLHQRHAAGERQ